MGFYGKPIALIRKIR